VDSGRSVIGSGMSNPCFAAFELLTGRERVKPDRVQGSMVRFVVLLALIGLSLAAGPAAAQFGNLFGNQAPPRPPADVPNGGFPAQPPPVGSPAQYPPPPPSGPPQSGIQSQPLAPPPGAGAAAPPAQGSATPPLGPPQMQRAKATPQQAGPSPQPANPAPPQPADSSPPPDDTIVTEMPTAKIANSRAVFAGLDKITGRTISFDAAIGETVQFGALQVTARVCYTRPPTEATNTDAFVEVDEVTLKGEIKRIFTGWMFAASPGLHAVEHPIYDVWLTDCASPETAPVAQSSAQPAAGTAGASATAQQRPRPAQPAPQPQRRPALQPIPPLAPPPVTND
jgi:hypothetical protein